MAKKLGTKRHRGKRAALAPKRAAAAKLPAYLTRPDAGPTLTVAFWARHDMAKHPEKLEFDGASRALEGKLEHAVETATGKRLEWAGGLVRDMRRMAYGHSQAKMRHVQGLVDADTQARASEAQLAALRDEQSRTAAGESAREDDHLADLGGHGTGADSTSTRAP